MQKYFLKMFLIILPLAISIPVNAAGTVDGMINKIDETGINLGDTDPQTPEVAIANIFQYILGFLGVIFFILIVYGGIIWMTAQGNEQKVNKAKSILTSASIGVSIVVFAYAISYLIIWALQSSM